MEQKLDLGKCYYKPSFFNMKIDLPIELDNLNEIPEGAMGLYYHEYIHFIQDISTIYGLMNISTITYYIQACASYIEKDKENKEFKVPIVLDEIIDKSNLEDKGLFNFSLRPIYLGSSIKKKSKRIENFKYQIVPFEFSPNQYIDKIDISFNDTETNEVRKLEFGGNQLTEGMAHLCEQFNYSDIIPKADEYPYFIVDKLVEDIIPELISEKLLIIVLCDISLMSYHPGLSFVRLLKHLKKIKYKDLSIDELYKNCLAHIKGNHVDYEVLVNNVKSEIQKNFNADYYETIKEWIDFIFDRILVIRTRIPTFFIDLVRFGKPHENQFFRLVMQAVGSPLVLNSESNGTISLPINFNPDSNNFNPGIFMALSQVLKIFYRDKPTTCDLKEHCIRSKESDPYLIVDENCDIAPWKKAMDKDLCPVGQIWHHWALKDFSPKYEIDK